MASSQEPTSDGLQLDQLQALHDLKVKSLAVSSAIMQWSWADKSASQNLIMQVQTAHERNTKEVSERQFDLEVSIILSSWD